MIQEPNNELWTAVKAINDPWPPDSEDEVKRLAEDWRKAGQAAVTAGRQVNNAQSATTGAWQDQAGAAAGAGIGKGAQHLQAQQQGAEQQAALADHYAQALTTVKQQITQLINANLPQFLQLQNAVLGPGALAMQQKFAQQVAAQCRAIVDQATAGLHAPPPPDTDSTLKNVGDWADIASGVLGVAALIPTPLSPALAAGSALAAGVGLAAHGIDAAQDGQLSGSETSTLIGDGLGVIPGVKGLKAAAEFGDAAHGWTAGERVLNGAIGGGGAGIGAAGELTDNSGVDSAGTAAGLANDGRNALNTIPRFAR